MQFQLSTEARLLLAHLRDAQVGQSFSYEALSEVISQPVAAAYTPLRTAILRLMRDSGMVFGCIRGVGIKRLSDVEIVETGAAAAEAIRRKARRSIEKQMKADFSKLSREHQMRFSAQTATLATVSMMTKTRNLEKLAASAKEGVKTIPISETLKMFAKR